MRYGEGPYSDARMAVCNAHALEGLQAVDGGIAEVRRVRNDPLYKCFCGQSADWYLLVMEEDH